VVDYVDSERAIIKADHNVDGTISREVTADIYTLIKFKRSKSKHLINQRPIVHVGERVAKGQVIADGPCTDRGELALGRNVLVGFMPWRGYNFEDAILVSRAPGEKRTIILQFTSKSWNRSPRHETRAGRDHARHSTSAKNMLRDLDDSGIIRIGAQVKPVRSWLVRSRLKAKPNLPEEKLLRAIFGEKAGDVKMLRSFRLRESTVQSWIVQVFTRKVRRRTLVRLAIEQEEEDRLRRDLEDEIRILREQRDQRIREPTGRAASFQPT